MQSREYDENGKCNTGVSFDIDLPQSFEIYQLDFNISTVIKTYNKT